jgi:hypothetical protein
MPPKPLPRTNCPIVLRTDFDYPQAWATICKLIRAPVPAPGDTFYAYVEFLDDPAFQGLNTDALLSSARPSYNHSFLCVVDTMAATHIAFPILVLDLRANPGSTFRAIPSTIQSIENNLSISNMDFFEFASAVDPDGIFRGFVRH